MLLFQSITFAWVFIIVRLKVELRSRLQQRGLRSHSWTTRRYLHKTIRLFHHYVLDIRVSLSARVFAILQPNLLHTGKFHVLGNPQSRHNYIHETLPKGILALLPRNHAEHKSYLFPRRKTTRMEHAGPKLANGEAIL